MRTGLLRQSLWKMPLPEGMRFTPEQVLEMTDTVDKSLLGKIAGQTAVPFDRDQLEEIYLLIDDSAFERISRPGGDRYF